MSLNIHATPGETKIYLADWRVNLNGDQQCQNFIATHITTEEIFRNVNIGLEFREGKLTECFIHEFGEKAERELSEDEMRMSLPTYLPNSIWQLNPDEEGLHQLGGDVPAGFRLPTTNAITPFQYLGYINNEDPVFSWLPFKVHLVCPIFLNIQNIYIDYSDPTAPVVINSQEVDNFTSEFDDLNKNSLIVFEEAKFCALRSDESGFDFGNAGLPQMIQDTEIPISPKSGKPMRFLCELLGGVGVRSTNIALSDEYSKRYFEKLNFWGDGYLYVFFEPE